MFRGTFVIVFMLSAKLVQSATNISEARFVPPPPPFLPPMLYPTNAATGILVAIAVPVPLDGQNVFVSYNFEANYNMPNQPIDSFPAKIVRWTSQVVLNFPNEYGPPDDGPGTVDDVIARDMKINSNSSIDVIAEERNSSTTIDLKTTTQISPVETGKKIKRSLEDTQLFTRLGFYHMIASRLDAYSIDGKKCLLLAICEASEVSFLEHNGVFGHLLHIILTPSSSMDENLPSEFTKAEHLGTQGNCSKYRKKCQLNVLELISKII